MHSIYRNRIWRSSFWQVCVTHFIRINVWEWYQILKKITHRNGKKNHIQNEPIGIHCACTGNGTISRRSWRISVAKAIARLPSFGLHGNGCITDSTGQVHDSITLVFMHSGFWAPLTVFHTKYLHINLKIYQTYLV